MQKSMDEFALIDTYFKNPANESSPLIAIGIGDDAACMNIPEGKQLLVTTDTLVNNVHFLNHWDAYDIAWKALMVNLSDIAAMGGQASFASLALTLPKADPHWLERFSEGLFAGLHAYQVKLIGGDITKGPLCITITMHGFIDEGKAIRRQGAKPGDSIWVSGSIGGAALAVSMLQEATTIEAQDKESLMQLLLKPKPRFDLSAILQGYASAAIDISDGLGADLEHICKASKVGASVYVHAVPAHALVKKYYKNDAAYFALEGGDDYELCFTVPDTKKRAFEQALKRAALSCYCIGEIQEPLGFRVLTEENTICSYHPRGYTHF